MLLSGIFAYLPLAKLASHGKETTRKAEKGNYFWDIPSSDLRRSTDSIRKTTSASEESMEEQRGGLIISKFDGPSLGKGGASTQNLDQSFLYCLSVSMVKGLRCF